MSCWRLTYRDGRVEDVPQRAVTARELDRRIRHDYHEADALMHADLIETDNLRDKEVPDVP